MKIINGKTIWSIEKRVIGGECNAESDVWAVCLNGRIHRAFDLESEAVHSLRRIYRESGNAGEIGIEFEIDASRQGNGAFIVMADSYEHAAKIAAKKLYGKKAFAMRQTGAPGMSGCWAAYENISGDNASAVGVLFGVSRV